MTIPAYNPVAITNASIITFIVSDPLGVGFAAIRSANPGADAPLLSAANAISQSFQVPNSPMTSANFMQLIDSGEFATLTTAEESQLTLMLSPGVLNIGTAAIQADLNALFANYPKSLAAIKAQYTQSASPWAYYFGEGQVATQSQLDQARNSGSGNNF